MATTTVTAQQVMDRVLRLIIVAGGESSVPEDIQEDFIFSMNQFVAELEANTYTDTTVTPNVTYGIDLGYTTVTGISETLTIDDGMVRPLIHCLVEEIAGDFGFEVPQVYQRRALQGRRTLLRMAKSKKGSAFSTRLPVGSGNEDDGLNYLGTGHYYVEGEQ